MKDVVSPVPPEEVRAVIRKCLEDAALVNYTRICNEAKIERTYSVDLAIEHCRSRANGNGYLRLSEDRRHGPGHGVVYRLVEGERGAPRRGTVHLLSFIVSSHKNLSV